MAKRNRRSRASRNEHPGKGAPNRQPNDLRIVGGRYRGHKLRYEPLGVQDDPVTRPMKHRVREAIFNLIGLEVQGCYAIDLFAGTGALGLEAISRGAVGATFIEKHVPTARIVATNITELGGPIDHRSKDYECIFMGQARHDDGGGRKGNCGIGYGTWVPPTAWDDPLACLLQPPLCILCHPSKHMLELITAVAGRAPAGSLVVVEADERFDFSLLPGGPVGEKRTDRWQVRTYPPAVVGVWRKSV